MGINGPHFCTTRGGVPALRDVEAACALLTRIEDRASARTGLRVGIVRRDLARQLRTGVGTLKNIRQKRRKVVPSELMEALRRALIEDLQAEIRAHEHEIAILKQTGADADSIIAAASSLHAAKQLIRAAVKS